jgi:hypothetical protein
MQEQEIYQNLSKAIEGNPNAEDVFKRRLDLNSDKEVDEKLHAIAHDISGNATLMRALEAKFQDPEKARGNAEQAFYDGMAKDVPDEKLRHLIAEQAANAFTEKVKGVNPHKDEYLTAMMKEEIPRKVNESIDAFEKGLPEELHKRLPGPVADQVAQVVEKKIAVDPDALRQPLSEALTGVYTKKGFLEEPIEQQRSEVRAAVRETTYQNFDTIFPLDNALTGMTGAITGVIEKSGIPIPDAVKTARDALHNTAKDVVSTFLAEEVADKAVPKAAESHANAVIKAVEVGINDIQALATSALGGSREQGGRQLA